MAVDTFFYGLFMDAALLRAKGIRARAPREGRLDDHVLAIGKRATLLSQPGRTVHGIVMALDERELTRLYSEPSVSEYRAQDVQVTLSDGNSIAARVYVLPPQLHDPAPNPEYAARLYDLARRLGLPDPYLQDIHERFIR